MRLDDRQLMLVALEDYFRMRDGSFRNCSKLSYTSAEAKAAIRALKQKGERRRMQSYRCDFCGGYHITSHPK